MTQNVLAWRCGRFLAVVLLLITCLALDGRCTLQAQARIYGDGNASVASLDPHLSLAGQKRPENVPANYVITPFGYLHPSCIHEVRASEELLSDGRLKRVDGSVDAEAPPACAFTRFKADGTPLNLEGHAVAEGSAAGTGAVAQEKPTINGYVEDATVTTGSSYGKLNGTWIVPSAPGTADSQTVYFFTGLEDLQSTQSILQPVLQWTPSQWAIASWNCCISGQAYHSSFVNVNQGDTIFGSIASTCASGTLTCNSWNVITTDQTLKQTTSFISNTNGQTFDWAFGGTLEVYGVNQCTDLPRSGNVSFTELALYNNTLNQVSPSWSVGNPSASISPKCDYNVSTSASQINIGFQNVPPSTPISGTHTLVPQNATGSALDDQSSKTAPGSPVDIFGMNGTGAQRWVLSTSSVVPGGFYNIAVSYGAYCLTGSANQGTQVQLEPCNGSLSQSWSAVPYGSGYTFSPALNTSLCLDVRSSGTANGTPVQVWGCDSTTAQEWVVR